jgi:hypothetical protein
MIGILWIMLGTTVIKPLDYDFDYSPVEQVSTQQIEQPLYEWWASWYDYSLNINWVKKIWSKDHDTCALRIYERYQTYKVCSDDKCITCYHNDYGPAREDRVIDLSSHAFKQLAPLSRWLVYVKVYLVED